jgi:hypothetical protein
MNVVYDFSTSQAYHYAPAIIDTFKNIVHTPAIYTGLLGTQQDVPSTMLNFDQQGNLYRVNPFYKINGAAPVTYYDVRRTYIKQH